MAVRKVTVTLPEELFEIVERARAVEHRTRSEVVQEALRSHFGEAVYVPSDEERRLLVAALDEVENAPEEIRDWDQVRAELRAGL
jgi:metal-responsive CopG/Arc/MetJ family transcriptional regulator